MLHDSHAGHDGRPYPRLAVCDRRGRARRGDAVVVAHAQPGGWGRLPLERGERPGSLTAAATERRQLQRVRCIAPRVVARERARLEQLDAVSGGPVTRAAAPLTKSNHKRGSSETRGRATLRCWDLNWVLLTALKVIKSRRLTSNTGCMPGGYMACVTGQTWCQV